MFTKVTSGWNLSLPRVRGARLLALMVLLVAAPAVGQETAAPPLKHQPAALSPQQLAIWNDPSFQQQFVQSYIAETEIEPGVTEEERKVMLKVLENISANKLDEAAKLLNKARNDASSAVFEFTQANIHFQREEFEQAASLYSQAVKKYPKFRRAWRNLALIQVRQNQFQQAQESLSRVLQLGGGEALIYGLLAFSFSSLEDHLAAESAYRMAMILDPRTMDWKLGLARSMFKQERYADAAAITRQLIADNSDRADLWLLQANAYIGMNQPMRAAENYEIIDRMGQSTVESLTMLADIYTNEQLFDVAVTTYLRALEMDPQKRPERALRAARVITAGGAFEETRRLATQLESMLGDKLNVENRKELLKLRARIAVADGASEEEVKVLEQIVELDPLDGEALIYLGQHAARSNQPEKAVFYFERAAGIEKTEADAKVRHAQLLVSQGKYAEALPLLRGAQQVKPRENVQKYLEQVERFAKAR